MQKRFPLRFIPLFALLPACSSGHRPATPAPQANAPLIVATGATSIEPAATDTFSPTVDFVRLGLAGVDRVYEVTTPAGVPFSFDVLSRAEGNAGSVRLSVAHALEGGAIPAGGVESLAMAGAVVTASGVAARNAWLDARGDGFGRVTISGSIFRDQVVAIEAETPAGKTARLVKIAIGDPSPINLTPPPHGGHPGVVSSSTIYSSDSWAFGLPTVAVSGDRTSIVVYEGDTDTFAADHRYEMRLQHDRTSGAVTGGGSDETTLDSGNWRDHEIAALFNVLAAAHCGSNSVTLRMSYDRGASFAQSVAFAAGSWATRLVQVAMASDYSLALVYCVSASQGIGQELVLVEGAPASFDANGSPTWYAFAPPQVLHRAAQDATPLLTGVAWSEGGDLVVGYAFNGFERDNLGFWRSSTDFRCAVRQFGAAFVDTRVAVDEIIGRDPSVALLGSGPSLEIFYAYEGPQGVRVRRSPDAGTSWFAIHTVGTANAHTPSVFARRTGAGTRVDLLFLEAGAAGTELHASRWSDFDADVREDYRLTTASMVPTAGAGGPANPWFGPMGYGQRITQVSWLGYDVARDGDQLVVVFDEETFDSLFICMGAPGSGPELAQNGTLAAPQYRPATPPPLAPGLTVPMPAPNSAHRHQLRLLRIE